MDTDDLPDFLGGEPTPDAAPAAEAIAATPEPAAEAAPAAEAPAAEPEAQAEGQPRGPDGKFAAATPPAEAAPAAQAEPAAATPAEPHHVPITALLDERDKRQALERERDAERARANELQAWREQQEAAARRQPIPSREENPAAWEQHREALIQNELRDMRLSFSKANAEVKHGEDVVAKAYQWGFDRCAADPYFNAKVAASANPVDLVVSEWKRDQLVAQVDPKEFESFQQWKAAQQAAAPAPGLQPPAQQTQAAQPAAVAAPRPSLAAGPSAGRADAAEVGDVEDTYEQMFRR